MPPANSDRPPPERAGPALDLRPEVEALCAALTEAGRRLGRLIAALRPLPPPRLLLRAAWAGLKYLKLRAKEES